MPERKVYNQTDCWKGLQSSDPDALGYLYDTYVDKLFAAACRFTDDRELAKDALHDVFVDIWKYRASLGSVQHTQSYLIRMLRNAIVKKMKAGSATVSFTHAEEQCCADANAEQQYIAEEVSREHLERLNRACSQLTERQRTVIKLRFHEGLSYKQIAAQLRMNYQSVNNLVFRTLISIRKEFKAF